jgi:tRNA(Ile)-lysidine synthase
VLQQFLNHIEGKKLSKTNDRILLAVSGGVDSMVMLHLFVQAGFNVGVAHCNFQLRPEEALEEENMVRNFCLEKDLDFNWSRFDTKAYAEQHNLSIQVAARNLRYGFFHKTAKDKNYTHIATAHHLNDNIETVLLNFIRGTGIDGMSGIPPFNDLVIRPLLFATRKEILDYARSEGLSWREDSSNQSDDYARNLLRNKVIPLIYQINPGLERTFHETVSRMEGTRNLLRQAVSAFEAAHTTRNGERILIKIQPLKSSLSPEILLWELLKKFGFRYDQCCKILASDEPGKFFYTTSHRLLVDRVEYVVDVNSAGLPEPCLISNTDRLACFFDKCLSIEERSADGFSLTKEMSVAQIDAEKVTFPITWRRWQKGDSFCPLGMMNRKKLSDFFVDLKIDRITKENLTVLESEGDIIWVVGYRISEKVRLHAETKRVLTLRLLPGESLVI